MHAGQFFARQGTTAREIRQQLEKAHAVRAKTAPRSTAQDFTVGDPVWVLRPQPMGTGSTKTWFTPRHVIHRIIEDTYCVKVGPDDSGSGIRVSSRGVSLTSAESMCPWNAPPTRLVQTMTMLSR